MALTYKQRAFVEHFLGDEEVQWNATGAARKAGYKFPNVAGPTNLVKPSIQRHIAARLVEMGASSQELVWRWLIRMRADISPFVGPLTFDIEGLKEAGLGFLIKGMRVTRNSRTYDLRDPDKAEEMLAKHLGMFVERREHSGEVAVIVKTVGGGVAEGL